MVDLSGKIFYYYIYCMKKRFLLIIILFICILSFITFFLILNYLDPYEYRIIGVIFIIFTFILWLSSLLTMIFYFFKKVYFRWKVYLSNVLSSFRQGFFVSIFLFWLIIFKIMWAWILVTWFLFFILILFLELFIQNISD